MCCKMYPNSEIIIDSQVNPQNFTANLFSELKSYHSPDINFTAWYYPLSAELFTRERENAGPMQVHASTFKSEK